MRKLLPTSCPKPRPKKKAKAKHAAWSIARQLPIRKSGRITPKPRSSEEYARVYGSRKRVAFVKRLPCVYCVLVHPIMEFAYDGVTPKCDNAHTANEGKSRKGHYTTIIPLCRSHHRMYDERRGPLGEEPVRTVLAGCANNVELLWQRSRSRQVA